MISTRILKIDSEIAEIIEVKVATCNITPPTFTIWISRSRQKTKWILTFGITCIIFYQLNNTHHFKSNPSNNIIIIVVNIMFL